MTSEWQRIIRAICISLRRKIIYQFQFRRSSSPTISLGYPRRKERLHCMDAAVHPIEPSISVPQPDRSALQNWNIDRASVLLFSRVRGISLAIYKQRHAAEHVFIMVVRENSAVRRNFFRITWRMKASASRLIVAERCLLAVRL